VQLLWALMVAAGLTCTRTRSRNTCADCKTFLLAFLQSALSTGLHVVYLILDNGSAHIPKQLGTGIASLELLLTVMIY
jgi:hypothetical protein